MAGGVTDARRWFDRKRFTPPDHAIRLFGVVLQSFTDMRVVVVSELLHRFSGVRSLIQLTAAYLPWWDNVPINAVAEDMAVRLYACEAELLARRIRRSKKHLRRAAAK